MTTVIGIALIVMAVFLVIAVLMQSSKDHRMGASIAGGAETFFGKQKGKSLDALFNKLTTIIAIIFVLLVIVLYVIQPESDYDKFMEQYNAAQQSEVVDNGTDDKKADDQVADDKADANDTVDNTVVEGGEGDISTDVEAGTDVDVDGSEMEPADEGAAE